MKLDPDAFQRGKDKARADRQRVAAGREESGNAFLSGRELAIEDALASKAHIDALAVALRRGGLPGTLQQLRVLAFNDLTQGRDPLDRLTGPRPADRPGRPAETAPAARRLARTRPATHPRHPTCPAAMQVRAATAARRPRQHRRRGDGDDDASWDGCPDMPQWQHERRGTTEDDDHHDGPGAPPGPPAPFPALINLTVPAGTAYGWSAAPGDTGGWGLTDPGDTRRLLQAASTASPHPLVRHPPRPRRHRRRARLRPRPPPLDPAAGRRPAKSRRTRRPAGHRARRTPARPEHHLHPDRQGQLRPRQPRRPLHPQPQTQRPGPRPHRPLHRTRLRRPGRALRPRPHPPLPRRNHLPVRPRTRLPPPPPMQASPRLAAHPARTRRHALDHARRAQLHHPAHRLRAVTIPARAYLLAGALAVSG